MALKRVNFATAHNASQFTSARWNFQPVPDGFGNAPIKLVEIAPGNPRFAYNPATGEPQGILIEEQRTFGARSTEINELLDVNGLVYSEGVANPLFDGQLTRVFNQSELNEVHRLSTSDNSIRGTSLQPNAFQLIIKPFGGLRYLKTSASGQQETIFDFEDEVVVEKNVGVDAQASIQKLIGYEGYYLVKYNIDRRTLSTGFTHRIDMLNDLLEDTFQGDSSAGFEIAYFGREYEKLNSSSPVLTTTTTVTRTADIVARTLGAEFNPNEGTFVVEFELPTDHQTQAVGAGVFYVGTESGTSTQQSISLFASGSIPGRYILRFGATNGVFIDGIFGKRQKASIKYDANFAYISISGGEVVSVARSTDPSLFTRIVMGSNNGSFYLNGTAPLLTYEPKAVSDARLQELSTL